MVLDAKRSGKLVPGGHLIETSSGNQGSGLAVVCTILGHPLTISMSKGNSPQRAMILEYVQENHSPPPTYFYLSIYCYVFDLRHTF